MLMLSLHCHLLIIYKIDKITSEVSTYVIKTILIALFSVELFFPFFYILINLFLFDQSRNQEASQKLCVFSFYQTPPKTCYQRNSRKNSLKTKYRLFLLCFGFVWGYEYTALRNTLNQLNQGYPINRKSQEKLQLPCLHINLWLTQFCPEALAWKATSHHIGMTILKF